MKLIDVPRQFNTDDKCLDYLEAMRWPSGVCCIECGSTKVSRIVRESKSKNKRTRLPSLFHATSAASHCPHRRHSPLFATGHSPLATVFVVRFFGGRSFSSDIQTLRAAHS